MENKKIQWNFVVAYDPDNSLNLNSNLANESCFLSKELMITYLYKRRMYLSDILDPKHCL